MKIEKKNDMIIRYINKNKSYIEERINYKELTFSERENRRKLSFIIKMNDMKKREEDIYNRTHICEFCNMVKSRNGICGC